MTVENSEDAAHVGVTDSAQQPGVEVASALAARTTDVDIPIDEEPPVLQSTVMIPPVIEVPTGGAVSDSTPPLSRKLAPPPKPRRDSGGTSRPPSARPVGELTDPLTSAALKAPLAPNISYAGLAVSSPVPESTPEPLAPSPAALSARPASDLGLVAATPPKPVTAPPRPVSAAPRPQSDPPPPRTVQAPAPAAPLGVTGGERPSSPSSSSALAAPLAVTGGERPSSPSSSSALAAPLAVAAGEHPSSPPSSSAIFAMRIIAVGEAARARPTQREQAGDLDPNAYPPSASRLGTGVRRSSRPKIVAAVVPDVTTATPPAAELLPAAAASAAEADAKAPAAAYEPELRRQTPVLAPAPAAGLGHLEELTDDDVSPDSSEQVAAAAAAEAQELEREDAISMPPEELAEALQAEAKTDPGKPPPPPKRNTVAPSSAPSSESSLPPPTPDLAAAKAAQRKNTRQPWWEDLFNEDFMRASSRVSDEQIRKEVTFIEESLGVAAGGVVLDLGCGAGHHAVEFASRGYGVVGYDLSLYQLALAADVAQERGQRINFLQGDMREMAFEEMFDGVFCWNTTFGYFEEDKNLAVAQRVFKALRPGGMFLIDVLNRDFAAASAPCTVWYEGDACVCMDDMSVDYISSRLRVKRSIILDDGRTKESLFSLRLYSLHELGKLLHEVGFRVTEASGHIATPGVFFGPNSPRIIMLAQRP